MADQSLTPPYDRAVLVDVLVYHYRVAPGKGCGCGWDELGRSWPEHVATVFEDSIAARTTSVDVPSSPQQYETVADAARRTGIGFRTLRRWIAEGRVPAYRFGPKMIRLDPADVDALRRPISNASTTANSDGAAS